MKQKNRVYLSSPTMHGEELKYMTEAYETNWMSTIGENILEVERLTRQYIGCGHAVALSSGTAALHMAVKLAGVKPGEKVFCQTLTFSATTNPIVYERGVPVFIDSEYDTWNMDPAALKKAFEKYPEVRVVVATHLYGTPCRIREIKEICDIHGAVLIEDAAESLGAVYQTSDRQKDPPARNEWVQTGCFGKYAALSFNGNKIITGSSGGMLLTDEEEAAAKVRKWSTQARERAAWYQHEELGYNYRMSNVIAGVIRGQYPHLEEHIAQKKEIYTRYAQEFASLPVQMNPSGGENAKANYWLSCLLIDSSAMCSHVRGEREALYISEPGKSCPTEILETLALYNIEARPVWKPLHMQPFYRNSPYITREGDGRAVTGTGRLESEDGTVLGKDGQPLDVSMDIFQRGLCLPSDIKMTMEQQDMVMDIVKECF